MKNAINNQVGMLGDMFLWLVANLKQGVIYIIKQALPPNKSAGSVCIERCTMGSTKAFLKSHFIFSIPIFHLKECNRKYAHYTRGNLGSKTRKTVVLPGFFKIVVVAAATYGPVLGSYLAWACALHRWRPCTPN